MTDGPKPSPADDAAPALWRRDEIDSPCIQLCVIHPGARICAGCYRTPDEIAQWTRFSPDERAAVKRDLPGRAGLLRSEDARPSRRRGRVNRRTAAPRIDSDATGRDRGSETDEIDKG